MHLTMREKLLSVLLALVLALGFAQIVNAQKEASTKLPDRFVPESTQPFERAGENFPGSAFYYLDDDSDSIAANNLVAPVDALGDGTLDVGRYGLGRGPIAPSLFARGSITDKARAVQCLTSAIYYEAALEPDAGQQAVAQVVLNRLMHPSYPNSVCGVVYQGSERQTGCQFTFSCDGSMARAPSAFYWNRAKAVATKALSGHVYAPVGLATHYHTTEVNPYWAPSLDFLGTIGAHRFYRWKGKAGLKSAFYTKYVGNEPYPGPKAKLVVPLSDDLLDPIKLARAYEDARAQSEAAAARQAAAAIASGSSAVGSNTAAQVIISKPPSYSREALRNGGEQAYGGSNLPGSSQIRPEYRNSGTWIARPGGQ